MTECRVFKMTRFRKYLIKYNFFFIHTVSFRLISKQPAIYKRTHKCSENFNIKLIIMLNNDYFERITKHIQENRLTNLNPVLYIKMTPNTMH